MKNIEGLLDEYFQLRRISGAKEYPEEHRNIVKNEIKRISKCTFELLESYEIQEEEEIVKTLRQKPNAADALREFLKNEKYDFLEFYFIRSYFIALLSLLGLDKKILLETPSVERGCQYKIETDRIGAQMYSLTQNLLEKL